jgi:hypothetical protein
MYAIVVINNLQVIMDVTEKDIIHDGLFYKDPVQRSRSELVQPVGLVVGLFSKRPYRVSDDFVEYRQFCHKHHKKPGKERSLYDFLSVFQGDTNNDRVPGKI